MSITPASWSLGTIIGLPVWGIILIALGVGLFLVASNRFDLSSGDRRGLLWILNFLFIGTVIFGSVVYWPFDAQYHRYWKVTGTVDNIGSRQISDGKSMSQRYVLDIGGQPFGVDDTRASLVKVGDKVTLLCKKEWQYSAKSGWACNWGDND